MYLAHRHWMALALRGLAPIAGLVVVAGIFVVRLLARQPDFLGRQPAVFDLLVLVLVLVALGFGVWLVYLYFDWRNDFLIVSNKRLIHEDRTLFFSFRYKTIPLDRVQNVNIRSEGLQKFFGYGRIEAQASGLSAPIVFERAVRPAQFQKQAMHEIQREKREQEQLRLKAAVQKRVAPQAPPMLVPSVPIEKSLGSPGKGLAAFFPFEPILVNGVVTWHRHWVALIKNLVAPLLILAGWLAALVLLPRIALFGATITAIFLVVFLGVALFFLWWQIEDWRNDVYMLDPSRVIDVESKPLGLFEDRREASLGAIQNVSASSPNFVAQTLGYGNVLIETAGTSGNLTFYTVPNPEQVQRMIFEYVDRFKWNQRERDWNNSLTIVESYVQLYEQLRQPPPPPPPTP